ncbi:unnamed protein product [Closterium sp. Yama58-4]|nr:unnamed protein product [Closterium sp. Yama58-4]
MASFRGNEALPVWSAGNDRRKHAAERAVLVTQRHHRRLSPHVAVVVFTLTSRAALHSPCRAASSLALLGLSWPSIAASPRRVLLQAGGAAASDGAAAFGSRVIFNSMQNVGVQDGGAISLTLDRTGGVNKGGRGAGFECSDAYSFGTFSVEAKMPAGYSAGVCATYFLQSGSYEQRNEWDFEFLGSPNNSLGMTLQTNAFMAGVGGQEELSAFGFDPAADFHAYSIQWGPDQTVWLVDGEVRRVMGSSNPAYPRDPMRVYFSIWDASTWATGPRTARIPVDYSYAPFVVTFRNFKYTAA